MSARSRFDRWRRAVRARLPFRLKRELPILHPIIDAFRDGSHETTEHAVVQALNRAVRLEDVAEGIRGDAPEVIEDYPADPRGPSCLVLCRGPSGIMYHVVVTHAPDVRLITVYRPDTSRWSGDLRRRLE